MQFSSVVGLSRHFGMVWHPKLSQTTIPRNIFAPRSLTAYSNSVSRSNFSSSSSGLSSVASGSASRQGSLPFWFKAAGVVGVGLSLSIFTAPKVFCEPPVPKAAPTPVSQPSPAAPFQSSEPPPPPPSSVSYLELTFGTVTGICAGVFVKKGAKALAFVLGGVFVLLQYLGSLSLVRVDWSRTSSRFENLFYSKDASGQTKAPNVASLFRWIIDFLTADFQQRASFIAGFVLGLRLG